MPRDVNQLAHMIGRVASGDAPPEPAGPPKNPAAVALGLLGGAKGGRARAKALSRAERVRIAKKASAARWGKKRRK